MSTDDGDDSTPATSDGAAPRRAYNRPRRYPVQAPPADGEPAAAGTGEVTRQNPTLAAAAQQYGRRHADAPGRAPAAYPAGHGTAQADAGPPSAPPPPAAPSPPTRPRPSRTPSTPVLLLIGAVLVVIVVVGLVVGLSGNDDPGTPGVAAQPTRSAPTTVAPSTAVASTAAPSSSPAHPGGDPPDATEVCTELGSTAPFTSFVAQPRPAERMPIAYVEPQAGTKVAVCVGAFRSGAGAYRGRLAYLAAYQQLPATQYALRLKTLGWVLAPALPRPTYRNNLGTTVTLVQKGTTLVTVVGTGR